MRSKYEVFAYDAKERQIGYLWVRETDAAACGAYAKAAIDSGSVAQVDVYFEDGQLGRHLVTQIFAP